MTRILAALFLLLGLALPAQAATCECRLASPTVQSDWLYLVGYNGNKVEWGGTSLTLPSGWQVKVSNAGLSSSTLYYVYAYDNSGVVALEVSATGHTADANGEHTKIGDPSRLLLGMVYTSPSGQFWRDAQHALILNWFNRLPIFAAPPAAGATTAVQQPAWDELGIESLNEVELLTWGYELGIANNIDLGVSGIATSSIAGGRVDLVFGILSLGPDAPVSSWISATSAAANQWHNVSGASTMGLPEGHHVVTFWARAWGGGTATIYVNTFASTNG
jgi:hypothetical protein